MADNDGPAHDEGFLRRWARLKSAAGSEQSGQSQAPAPASETPVETEAGAAKTDADMPPLEALDADSDYSGFLSPEVSQELRRLALRKLFRAPRFNVRDGLDDYDENYRNFSALGNIVTADMRHEMERLARKAQMENASADEPGGSAPASTPGREEPASDAAPESPVVDSSAAQPSRDDPDTPSV